MCKQRPNVFISPAPGTVPRRGETPYVLSERKGRCRQEDGHPRVTPDSSQLDLLLPLWRETEAAGVPRFMKTEQGKDGRLPGWGRQQRPEGGQPLLPGCPPASGLTHAALTRTAVLHVGERWTRTSYPHTYGNAVTSSSGQVNVIRVCRYTTISPGDIGCRIFTDAVDALASAVRSC